MFAFRGVVLELSAVKRKTLPTDLPSGIVVRAEDNSWMNSHLIVDWLKTVWENRPGAMLARRSMLVLDAFRGHNTEEVKTCLADDKTDLVMFPPMDVCLNNPFEAHVKRMYTEWIAEEQYADGPDLQTSHSNPTQSVPNGTILYHNGIPYTYHNGMAFFVTPETAYQYSATSQTTTPAATTSSYPVVYQPSMYYPQHTAYQYQNVIPSQWNASSGQWRWAPPSVGHPAYVYPTAAMMSMGGGIGGGDTSSEYQDPAIVETGTEVGALGLMLRKEDGGGGGGGGALTASMAAAVGLNSFWPKVGGGNPGFHQPASASLDCSSATVPGRPVLDDNAGAKPPCTPSGKPAAGVEQQPAVPCRQFLPPRQRRYTAPPETPLANADGAQVAPTVSVAGFQTPSKPSAAQQAPGGTACSAAATLPRLQGQALPGRSAPKGGRGRGLAFSHPRPMWTPLQDAAGISAHGAANGLLLR
ncbi:hypothetical protein HPB47_002931 [Ixodes persulcatus]|uniref:Uncharacterized protein n=1 Tax=Ixodes persulcatus TaxID=34615 RepID=A0AC60PJT2_IXOPE|nr:hypothetical protein HPB47_002931 [Ixodes persulcatus]